MSASGFRHIRQVEISLLFLFRECVGNQTGGVLSVSTKQNNKLQLVTSKVELKLPWLVVSFFVFMVAGCGDQLKDSKEIYRLIFESIEFPGKVIHLQSTAADPNSNNKAISSQDYFHGFRVIDTAATLDQAYFESLKVVLIKEEELKSIFSQSCEENWKAFHNTYPDAGTLFAVSHIGFADHRKRAIVYLEGMSSCKVSEGVMYSLEKSDGEWKIIDFVSLWNT